jgi:hypothetical protein
VRLVSFAVHWIRAEMHEFILKNWRIVKVATTKAQRKLFFNLRKSKTRLGWMNAEEVRAVAAKDLNVSEREVLEMESRLSGRDIGFDAPADEDEDHAPPAPAAYLMAQRRRSLAGLRARRQRRQPARTAARRPGRTGCPLARHHQASLARRGQQGHAAGAGRRVRRLRRTHPPGRGERAEEDEGIVRRVIRWHCTQQKTRRCRVFCCRYGGPTNGGHLPVAPDRWSGDAITRSRVRNGAPADVVAGGTRARHEIFAAISAYARWLRIASTVSPSAHTHSTRPPAGDHVVACASSAVPAWNTLAVAAHLGPGPIADDIAERRRARVRRGGHHHAEGRALDPTAPCALASRAVDRRLHQVHEVRAAGAASPAASPGRRSAR